MEKNFKSRKYIIDDLIKEYCINMLHSDYPKKVNYLKDKLKCMCTDCGGKNAISECNLEIKYYKKF